MFVSEGAVEVIREKRKEEFFDRYIVRLAEEARKLSLTKKDVEDMIERGFTK